jgi:FKBP-type peptidyl-prolyl cis-trans isomerase FkpA
MKAKLGVLLILILSACLDDGGISPQQQLEKDIAAIDEYLSVNGISAIEDASGIRIVIEELGTAGLPPNEWNNLEADYVGRLLSNGTIFDDGTVDSPLLSYILGWQVGLRMLPEGTKAKLYVPSVLGYGATKVGDIPKNSNLVFDIDLKSVTLTQQQTDRLALDLTAIENYLTDNNITNTTEHESGIRYSITPGGGDGPTATWFSKIKIAYKVKIMSSGVEVLSETVEPTTSFSSRVVNYTPGHMVALQLMREGDTGVFYVPSGIAYGPRSYVNLPANTNVIFEIELLDIIL